MVAKENHVVFEGGQLLLAVDVPGSEEAAGDGSVLHKRWKILRRL